MPFKTLHYDDSFDYLRLAYRRGLLVPFIGSGLSTPAIPVWPGFIRNLAKHAGIKSALGRQPSDQKLILESERLVSTLRGQGKRLANGVEVALGCSHRTSPTPTDATNSLASVWWPLVLTTNYDRMFQGAFNHRYSKRHYKTSESMVVLGRNAADCRTLLGSLGAPMRPLLWALQGFLGTSHSGADLRDEIVVGYDQYREATFNNPGFRAAFTEVFRNRSLFFLGAGLSEEYFRGLFGEALTRFGPSQHTHCALVNAREIKSGKVDPWFLHTRLNIVVMTYKDQGAKFSGFAPCLKEICEALTKPQKRERVFVPAPAGSRSTIEFLGERLPHPHDDHWVVVSAGRDKKTGDIFPSQSFPGSMPNLPKRRAKNTKWIWHVGHEPILLAVTRNPTVAQTSGNSRDLRTVSEATYEALDVAVRGGGTTISLMLLAAGGGRRWPRVFSLVQMLRGIRRFFVKRRASSPDVRILVHDTRAADYPDVWHAVQSRRLDLEEITTCEALRCFVEIHDGSHTGRIPMYLSEETGTRKKTGIPIGEIAQFFHLSPDRWIAEVEPNPFVGQGPIRLTSLKRLSDLGIVPGSTIRFSRLPRIRTRILTPPRGVPRQAARTAGRTGR